MKNRKSMLIALLLTAALALSVAACNGKKANVTLVDFPATFTEQPMSGGDVYTLRRDVSDEDGNKYRLSYDVKTGDGEDVNVIMDTFTIADSSGYVITYTAMISTDNMPTSVVTVPVDDKAPTMGFGAVDCAIVGHGYTLPDPGYEDDFDGGITEYKLYKTDGTTESEVQYTEENGVRSFVPASEGTYRVEAKGADEVGHTVSDSASFEAVSVAANMLFDPSIGETATRKLVSDTPLLYSSVTAVAAEDNDGAGGYDGPFIKMTVDTSALTETSQWSWFGLAPLFDADEYADFDYVQMWVRGDVDPAHATEYCTRRFETRIAGEGTAQNAWLQNNTWTRLVFDMDDFLAHLERFATIGLTNQPTDSYADPDTGWKNDPQRNTAAWCFGRIEAFSYSIGEAEVTPIEEDEEGSAKFTVTSRFAPDDIDIEVTVTDPKGGNVTVVKGADNEYTAGGITQIGTYTIKVALVGQTNATALTRTFDMTSNRDLYLANENLINYPAVVVVGSTIDLTPGEVFVKAVAGNSAPATIKVKGTDGNETPETGQYEASSVGKIEINYYYNDNLIASFPVHVVENNVLFDPSLGEGTVSGLQPNITLFKPGVIGTASREDAATNGGYEGGYVRFDIDTEKLTGASYPRFGLIPLFDADDYAEYEYISLWVRVDAEAGAPYFRYEPIGASPSQVVFRENNKWHRLIFNAVDFIKCLKSETHWFMVTTITNASGGSGYGETAWYFGRIEGFSYSIGEATVTPIEEYEEGSAKFTVTSRFAPDDIDIEVTVTDPKGGSVTVNKGADNEYTAGGITQIGTYTIKVALVGQANVTALTRTFDMTSNRDLYLTNADEINYSGVVVVGSTITLIPGEVFVKAAPGNSATATIKVKDAEGNETPETDEYTASSVGKIEINYYYEETLVGSFPVYVIADNTIFDPGAGDASLDYIKTDKENLFSSVEAANESSYHDANYSGPYVKFTLDKAEISTTATNWIAIDFDFMIDVQALKEAGYKYFSMWVRFDAPEGYTPRKLSSWLYKDVTTAEDYCWPTNNAWDRIVFDIQAYEDCLAQAVHDVHNFKFGVNNRPKDSYDGADDAAKEAAMKSDQYNGTISVAFGKIEAYSIDMGTPSVDAEGGRATFTVSGKGTVPPYSVTVKESEGSAAALATTHEGDNWTVTGLEKGKEYAISVVPEGRKLYNHPATAIEPVTFACGKVLRFTEEDVSFPAIVKEGDELRLPAAEVYAGSQKLGDAEVALSVTRSGDDWTPVEPLGDSYAVEEGVLAAKITYSLEGEEICVYNMTVAKASVLFDPSLGEGTVSGLQPNITLFKPGVIGTASREDAATNGGYEGGYVRFDIDTEKLTGASYPRFGLIPLFDADDYAEYEYISLWVRVDAEAGAPWLRYESIVSSSGSNKAFFKENNKWHRLIFRTVDFIKCLKSETHWFMVTTITNASGGSGYGETAWYFGRIEGIDFEVSTPEVSAVEGGKATASFDVTSSDPTAKYTVEVKKTGDGSVVTCTNDGDRWTTGDLEAGASYSVRVTLENSAYDATANPDDACYVDKTITVPAE